MQRTINPRRVAIAVALILGAGPATSLSAQQGGQRMQLLVTALANQSGTKHSFGEKTAQELDKRIGTMDTHEPLQVKDVRDALKKLGLKEEDLMDCVKAMQFASLQDIPLVLCGTYQEAPGATTVAVKIINPKASDVFEIPPFQAADPKTAADQIVKQFTTYIEQLSMTVYCNDYVASQQWENALTNCNKALALNPKSKPALYAKATALSKMDRKDEALATYKQLLEVDQLHQDAILAAAIVAAELGKKDESSKYFQEYLQLNPGSIEVRLKIASDAAAAGDSESALKILEDGIAADTGADVTLKMYAGHFAMNVANAKMKEGANGNNEAARPFLEKAVTYYTALVDAKGAETDVAVLRNMLIAYRTLEQQDQGLAFGQRAIGLKPDDAELHSQYADALDKAGRRDEAIAMLDRAAQLDPNQKVNTRKGLWMLQGGNLAGARAAWSAAKSKGELEGPLQDQLAKQIAAAGFQEKHSKGEFGAAQQYYDVAKEFATSAETRGMIAFFEGYSVYQQAVAHAGQKSDVATARASLPRFQRVVELMGQAAAYPEAGQNRAQILDAARQYIERARAIIARRD